MFWQHPFKFEALLVLTSSAGMVRRVKNTVKGSFLIDFIPIRELVKLM